MHLELSNKIAVEFRLSFSAPTLDDVGWVTGTDRAFDRRKSRSSNCQRFFSGRPTRPSLAWSISRKQVGYRTQKQKVA